MEIRREQEFVRDGFALQQVLGTETGAPFPSSPLTACLEALKVPDPAVPRTHPTSLLGIHRKTRRTLPSADSPSVATAVPAWGSSLKSEKAPET